MKAIRLIALVAVLLTGPMAYGQGSLDPTNTPAPTMHSLEELYQEILDIKARLDLEGIGRPPGYNLDLGNAYTGLPDNYGAASNQKGPWNDVAVGASSNLCDTAGETTTASVVLFTGVATFFPTPPATTAGALLRDLVLDDLSFFQSFTISVAGLDNGWYDVYYYRSHVNDEMLANGVPMNDLAGGSLDSLGAQGSNWDVVTVMVSDGTLTIEHTGFDGDGLAGIQIVPK